eukprot:CAMPEP_0116543714 /NCGR_PEP_ID=MMETSP0397-20121206/1717_1 /TAXON_ID=216820 /ORGANISM="Cyclophora tenuis, Strain ECT3854" /LENGTH=206 /DNA_ID=CAMNT_0004067849 /DNA_START=198 /DNA_END=818 /DNA_ORIENTATION=-
MAHEGIQWYIPTSASKVRFQIDFFEIDSWNADNRYGPDCIYIWIDDTRVFIGIFSWARDEGQRSGSKSGIRWESESQGPPTQIGFGRIKDQKHTIKVYIPPNYYSDGKFVVKLETQVTGSINDESSGWDNVRVAYLYHCRRMLGGKDTRNEYAHSQGVDGLISAELSDDSETVEENEANAVETYVEEDAEQYDLETNVRRMLRGFW